MTPTARTADDLPYLSLLVAWATTARLIRVHRGRLVAVARARNDVDDPAALAVRAVRALPEVREQLLPHPSRKDGEGLPGEWSALFPRFADLLADLLAALYGMPVASPGPRRGPPCARHTSTTRSSEPTTKARWRGRRPICGA
ncbi:hypothetical protein OG879_28925 [Streptomyces caniferus]|uniref:hypothetical protein n=1 Tax=Streptomyces caniferus TaxID=285557 RepID=UPI002E280C25|nr:hypothetical protein [Streptomyces caniferus]